MDKLFLVLKLDGPFQSYSLGKTEKYNHTSQFPTKSAIIGMLGSAFGYPQGDNRLIELCDSLKMAVRMDYKPTIMQDLQVITDSNIRPIKKSKDPFQFNVGFSNVKGGLITDKRITTKEYLVDGEYTVILEGKSSVIQNCIDALKDPVWICTLGRNICFPATPILGLKKYLYTEFEDLNEALENIPVISRRMIKEDIFQYELELTYTETKKYPKSSVKEQYDNVGVFCGFDYRKRYVLKGFVKGNVN